MIDINHHKLLESEKKLSNMKKLFVIYFVILVSFFVTSCLSKKNQVEFYPIVFRNGERKIGYVNQSGKTTVKPIFDYAELYSEGLAVVGQKTDSGLYYGFADKTGKIAIPCIYVEVTAFSDGIAWVAENGGVPTAIDNKGDKIFDMQQAIHTTCFNEGRASFSVYDTLGNEIWGILDKEGSIIVEPKYENAVDFSEGLAAVHSKDGKWGYIDKTGKQHIAYQFDKARPFINGVAVVRLGDKEGLIDKDGKYVVNPQYEMLSFFGKNYLFFKKDAEWGWCDYKGNVVVNPQFDECYWADNSKNTPVAAVCIDDKWGYVDKTGKITIQPQFDEVYMYNQKGNAPVIFDEKVGFIDKKGKYITNPIYGSESCQYWHFSYSCKSQVFNPKIIANLIDYDKMKWLLNSNFSDIILHYDLSELSFDKYSEVQEIWPESKMTDDFKMRLYVNGSPYVKEKSGYYYTWYERVFRPYSTQTKGITYAFKLQNPAVQVKDNILKNIDEKLCKYGFSFDESKNTYTKDDVIAEVSYYNNVVTVVFCKKSDVDMIYRYRGEARYKIARF